MRPSVLALLALAAAAAALAAAGVRPPTHPTETAPSPLPPDPDNFTAALADAVAARLGAHAHLHSFSPFSPAPSLTHARRILGDALAIALASAVAVLATAVTAKRAGGGGGGGGWGAARDAAARARFLDALRAGDDAALRRALGSVALPAWARFPDFERADFVNTAVANAWPYVASAVAGVMQETVNPLLAAQKPSWLTGVRVDRCDLGPRPPTVEGIKTYARSRDAIIFEADVDWRAATLDVELVVQPLPSRLPVPLLGRAPLIAGATRTLARAVKVRAGVERVAAAARVRVELAPLLRELPVAGAVSVSLVAPPDVRFALTVYGGDVTLVPGLEGFLASVLRDAVRPYVLPGRFTYPLVPGPAPGVSLPTGMAFVTVVEATNLPWMDVFSPSDAYVELSIGGGRPHRTRVVPNSSNPTWDQDVALLVHAPATQLEAIVMDFDRFDKDDEVGRAIVDVADLPASPPPAPATGTDATAPPPAAVDVWLPITRTTTTAHSVRDEWARPAHGAVGHVAKAARLGAATARSGCGVRPLVRRVRAWCVGGGGGGEDDEEGDGVAAGPRLHLRIAYHSFSREEQASAAKAAAGRVHPAQRASPDDSAAVDLLKGGLLVVRPRAAAGLPHSPLASAFGVKPHWIVRAALAGVAAETGPVSTGAAGDPMFNEPVELVVGARALAAAGPDANVLLHVIDARRRRRLAGTAALKLAELMATGHLAGEWSLELHRARGRGVGRGDAPPLPTVAGDSVRRPSLSAEVVWVGLVGGGAAGAGR